MPLQNPPFTKSQALQTSQAVFRKRWQVAVDAAYGVGTQHLGVQIGPGLIELYTQPFPICRDVKTPKKLVYVRLRTISFLFEEHGREKIWNLRYFAMANKCVCETDTGFSGRRGRSKVAYNIHCLSQGALLSQGAETLQQTT